jgi:drug/metabolite transporter (DMT)-like permease
LAAQLALLVIVSAFLHAGWNAILKRRPEPENAVVGVLAVAGLSSAVLASAKGFALPPLQSLVWSLAAGVVMTAYFVTLAKALSRAQLGSVYTIVRGGALLVVWPVSIVVFGERVTPLIAVGTLLVITGLAAAGASESKIPALEAFEQRAQERAEARSVPPPSRGGAALVRAGLASHHGQSGLRGPSPSFAGFRRSAPSFADAMDLPPKTPSSTGTQTFHWAVVCAVFAALYQVGYKMALTKGGQPEAVVSITMLTASAVQVAVIGRARRIAALAELRAAPLAVIGAGLVCTLGFVLFVRAMEHGGAGVLTTIRNTSVLFAQGLALLAGERPKRLALIGAVLVTGGAVLLSF